MNKLAPGSGKYKVSTIPFMQMENIARFLEGAEKLGVPKHDLFQTVDLYEKKNMTQVVDAIFSISRYAYKAGVCSTYLGPKLADKQSNTFSQEQLNESNTIYSTFQYGYNKGANQSGMTTFGARRQISGDKY
ncbi:calponin homology domain-containing protein [Dichotomocladium elegans]|nr:calponin homology domain-containing protein [Dichotomocladium elegans]